MKETRKREYGLDLLKVFACLGVVALHTLLRGKGPVNMVIARLSVMAIPLFVMISGYLMMSRPSLDYRYALKKVLRILVVCFCWELLHATAYYLYYRETRDFLKSFVLDFFQAGLFYHFWYMGSLILLYLLMPLLDRLQKQSVNVYRTVLLVLCCVNAIFDLTIIIFKHSILSNVPQSLHVWFWLEYAMLGGLLARDQQGREWILSKVTPLRMVLMLFLLVTLDHVFVGIAGEVSYGAVSVQLTSLSVFACACKIRWSDRWEKCLLMLSALTMGIYIMHPFVLAVLNKFVPAFTGGGAVMNLLFWLLTTAVCAVATVLVQKIPILNRLLKL